MRLAAALIGDLEQVMRDEMETGARAVTAGTRTTVDIVKNALRAETMAAFSSARMANTWRGKVWPEGRVSLGAAGVVSSAAPRIIEAFSKTTTIRSKSGFFLAIPSPEALAMRGKNNDPRPTPDLIERRLGIKLQFVYRANQSSLLVANLRVKAGKHGGFAAPLASSRRTASVVMFFLVPFVRLKQVFDLDRTEDRALDDLVRNIMAEWDSGRTEA